MFGKKKFHQIMLLVLMAMLLQVAAPVALVFAEGVDISQPLESDSEEGLNNTSGGAIEVGLGEGGNLEDEKGFNYEVNLYVGEDKLEDGSIIEIEDLSVLEYWVDFTIEDGFQFEGNEYLELDLSSLTGLGELVLPEAQRFRRCFLHARRCKVGSA